MRSLIKILFILTWVVEHRGPVESQGFVHRDLKPENFLLVSASDDVGFKLADFGFAKRCPRGEKALTDKVYCGTGLVAATKGKNCKHWRQHTKGSTGGSNSRGLQMPC